MSAPPPDRDLTSRDLAVFWHPCSQMRDYRDFPPLEVVGARGTRLRLADGREILDAIASWWCKALGHGHPRLVAALRAQADAFEHVITANTTSAPLVRFCERLLAAANGLPPSAFAADAPPGRRAGHFGKVFLAESGSTAVEIALKMALQAQAQRGARRRTRFAALENGYHGETVGALSVGNLSLYAAPYRELCFPVQRLAGLPYRRGPGDPDWLDASAEWPAIEAALDAGADTLAAVVYEPILQAAGGMRFYSPDLLRRLRRWADTRGVYLVADEIAAGMGRLGAMLASHLADGPGPRVGRGAPRFRRAVEGADRRRAPPVRRRHHRRGVCAVRRRLRRRAGVPPLEHVRGPRARRRGGQRGARRVLGRGRPRPGRGHRGAPPRRARVGRRRAPLHGRGPRVRDGRRRRYLLAPGGRPLEPRRRTGYAVYQEAVRRGALLRPLGDTMYLFPPLTATAVEIDEMIAILADAVDAVLGRA